MVAPEGTENSSVTCGAARAAEAATSIAARPSKARIFPKNATPVTFSRRAGPVGNRPNSAGRWFDAPHNLWFFITGGADPPLLGATMPLGLSACHPRKTEEIDLHP